MKPWRAAETRATASGKSTRIASRRASACASAVSFGLNLRERGRGQLDGRVQRERRVLLALGILHRLRLLLGELAQRCEEVLGIAAERKEATAFHDAIVRAGHARPSSCARARSAHADPARANIPEAVRFAARRAACPTPTTTERGNRPRSPAAAPPRRPAKTSAPPRTATRPSDRARARDASLRCRSRRVGSASRAAAALRAHLEAPAAASIAASIPGGASVACSSSSRAMSASRSPPPAASVGDLAERGDRHGLAQLRPALHDASVISNTQPAPTTVGVVEGAQEHPPSGGRLRRDHARDHVSRRRMRARQSREPARCLRRGPRRQNTNRVVANRPRPSALRAPRPVLRPRRSGALARPGSALAALPRLASSSGSRPRPRRRYGNGTRRRRAPPRRIPRHRARPERGDARSRAQQARTRRRSSCTPPQRPSPLRTQRSTTSPSPICSATSTTRVRRSPSSRASFGPAAPSPRSSSASRAGLRGPLWDLYVGVGLPLAGRALAKRVERGRRLSRRLDPGVLGALSARAPARALAGSRAARARSTTPEPRRRGRHLGATGPETVLVRARPRWLARLRHLAPPAVHRLASLVRRDRRLPGARDRVGTARRRGRCVRAGRRRGRARTRRAPWSTAPHDDSRHRPRRARRGLASGRPARSGSSEPSPSAPGSRCWFRSASSWSSPTTSSWQADGFTRTCGSGSPGVDSR